MNTENTTIKAMLMITIVTMIVTVVMTTTITIIITRTTIVFNHKVHNSNRKYVVVSPYSPL